VQGGSDILLISVLEFALRILLRAQIRDPGREFRPQAVVDRCA
jgi:hypothetical protein